MQTHARSSSHHIEMWMVIVTYLCVCVWSSLLGEPSQHAHTIDEPDLRSSLLLARELVLVLIVVNRWARLSLFLVRLSVSWRYGMSTNISNLTRAHRWSIMGKSRLSLTCSPPNCSVPCWSFPSRRSTDKQKQVHYSSPVNIEYFFTLIVRAKKKLVPCIITLLLIIFAPQIVKNDIME